MSVGLARDQRESAIHSQVHLWQVEICPRDAAHDHLAAVISSAVADLRLNDQVHVRAAHGYLVEGEVDLPAVEWIAKRLLVDGVTEVGQIGRVGETALNQQDSDQVCRYVLFKPGVTDAIALTALHTMQASGFAVRAVRTYRKYWISGASAETLTLLERKVIANASIEEVVALPLQLESLATDVRYDFELLRVPLLDADETQLMAISRQGGLSLNLLEMQTIQNHFRSLDRNPTDIELETIAQTWSEHCSHKTLAGRIEYEGPDGRRTFQNMLKETIFKATTQLRQQWGDKDWCVSVFKDNAGVVKFDDQFHVCFKVETHNRPSALEPYGGANTGVGGVIRDTLGTGLGAKPICSTDVFCFAPPDMSPEELPEGVLHPARIMRGVVAGVRDYGNRMGIPTVNGAIYFDRRYVGNPLVFCGNVGLIPVDKSFKQPQSGDLIVALGGRTGRDGIHGATFSSVELTDKSEKLSGGAVQIGNAIIEKMVQDVLLQARDRELYSAVTDCGAGGFSSAVGEMAEGLGAVVDLELAPLKYQGLSYTEIWISEAQERMVLSVPPENWTALQALCHSESVEATVLGHFTDDRKLQLRYHGQTVGHLDLKFMHDGRPPVVRQAKYTPTSAQPYGPSNVATAAHAWNLSRASIEDTLLRLLGELNIASKQWVIQQYDHEVQGGSVVKPLVGAAGDGPSDAAALRPRLDSARTIIVGNGMAPRFSDFDTYHAATSAMDEAVRNCVATGAIPSRIAVLDNFSWGYTDRPETLGALVRAAIACHDLALAWQVPFISGKDSLNNEFSYHDAHGQRQTIRIPHTLLISALGQADTDTECVSMDLKRPGNRLLQIGATYCELAGSHFSLVRGLEGGQVPEVRPQSAWALFETVHRCIKAGWISACHDLSEGGLAVAISEMAFAGRLGATIDLSQIEIFSTNPNAAESRCDTVPADLVRLFSESNSRFVIEVPPAFVDNVRREFATLPISDIGVVTDNSLLVIRSGEQAVAEMDIDTLRERWQKPLAW
ncbi:MAG: phosphoribosylformylglycinamidine synthase subunit PurL [Planctomycetaceae bacterium]|nr:phosphoribosylformylglycinamidine synthase subunit PurL [Planctomycetaceae bacterium]